MCSFFFYLPRSVNLAITLISEVELLVLQSSKSLQNHNSAQSSVDSQSTSYEEKLFHQSSSVSCRPISKVSSDLTAEVGTSNFALHKVWKLWFYFIFSVVYVIVLKIAMTSFSRCTNCLKICIFMTQLLAVITYKDSIDGNQLITLFPPMELWVFLLMLLRLS